MGVRGNISWPHALPLKLSPFRLLFRVLDHGVDRSRGSKFLEAFPSDCGAWSQFAALEGLMGETERSRAVYELAIRQPVLDMPETLWKAYIDFEVRIQ